MARWKRENRDTGCPILGSQCAVGAREVRPNSWQNPTSSDQTSILSWSDPVRKQTATVFGTAGAGKWALVMHSAMYDGERDVCWRSRAWDSQHHSVHYARRTGHIGVTITCVMTMGDQFSGLECGFQPVLSVNPPVHPFHR